MKVLIVSFNFFRENENNIPYGISCLMDAFNKGKCGREGGMITSLNFDLNEKITSEDVMLEVIKNIKESRADVLALSNYIWCDRFIQDMLPVLKRDFRNLKIIMGGPMVCYDEKYLTEKYPGVDVFIKSYGEKIFSDLDFYINEGHVLFEENPDFAELQSPYLSGSIPLEREGMSVRMETRRGCIFNCSYCRHRNANCSVYRIGGDEKIKAELEFFKDRKVSKINLLDPFSNDVKFNPDRSLNTGKMNGLKFLNLLRETGTESHVSLQIRPEMLVEPYIEEACRNRKLIFEIGIQSLDPEVYPLINRGNLKARKFILEKLSRICREKINSEITLIYGLPGQTASSFYRDIDLLKKMGFDDIKAFPLQIYPATGIYGNYMQYGLKASPVEPYGIMQVYDNPGHDFRLMERIAGEL